MKIPFDTTPPTTRSFPVTFNTDEATAEWLEAMKQETGLDRSLILHRIVTQAREATGIFDGERRRSEDRRKVS